jgi:hypothetical protein
VVETAQVPNVDQGLVSYSKGVWWTEGGL